MFYDSSQFPGSGNDSNEFFICINRAADILIILTEFLYGYDAVFMLSVPKAHEFNEDLLIGLFARDYLWMVRCIIDLCNII